MSISTIPKAEASTNDARDAVSQWHGCGFLLFYIWVSGWAAMGLLIRLVLTAS